MDSGKDQFWMTKELDQLNQNEWESICDGCGNCCMVKIQNEETGQIETTTVSCKFLDIKTCRCMIYDERLLSKSDCIKLSPENIKKYTWLPETCAYRRLSEGKSLDWWHPLISGDHKAIHQEGISVRDRAVSEQHIHPHDIYKDT